VPAADGGHTNINSSIPPLRGCILLHCLHFAHPLSELCCRYKLSLLGCLVSRAMNCRVPGETTASHLTQRWARSNDRVWEQRGEKTQQWGRPAEEFTLRYDWKLHEIPWWFEVTPLHASYPDPRLIPTSELTQSSPISCSSFHHWVPTPACCSAGLPCRSLLGSSCFAWQRHGVATLSSPSSLLPLAGWREPVEKELGDDSFSLAEPADLLQSPFFRKGQRSHLCNVLPIPRIMHSVMKRKEIQPFI